MRNRVLSSKSNGQLRAWRAKSTNTSVRPRHIYTLICVPNHTISLSQFSLVGVANLSAIQTRRHPHQLCACLFDQNPYFPFRQCQAHPARLHKRIRFDISAAGPNTGLHLHPPRRGSPARATHAYVFAPRPRSTVRPNHENMPLSSWLPFPSASLTRSKDPGSANTWQRCLTPAPNRSPSVRAAAY